MRKAEVESDAVVVKADIKAGMVEEKKLIYNSENTAQARCHR